MAFKVNPILFGNDFNRFNGFDVFFHCFSRRKAELKTLLFCELILIQLLRSKTCIQYKGMTEKRL